MKRKILGMLLVGSASLFVVGCENKKEEEKKEDKTPKIVCTQNEEEDGMKSNTTVTLLLRDNTYVKEYKAEVKLTIDDEDLYKIYSEAVKNDSEEETDEDVEYKYDFDDASKTITTTIKAVVTDEKFATATDEEKEEMKIKTLVERAESDNGKCEFKNVTRGDVGL